MVICAVKTNNEIPQDLKKSKESNKIKKRSIS